MERLLRCARNDRASLLLTALWLGISPPGYSADPLSQVRRLAYTVAERVPHDRTLFTQGVTLHGSLLVESGGGYGDSRLLVRTLAQRDPIKSIDLPAAWFAEGLAVHENVLYLLTWHEGIAQTYSLPSLQPLRRLRYPREGWGLASDGTALIQSDGSNVLVWRDATDFSALRRLEVTVAGKPLSLLNELEWIDGWIVANVWQSDWVVGIDPATGQVEWTLSLRGLLNHRELSEASVANGIAWDTTTRRMWVTGKLWPWLFALRLDIPPVNTPPAELAVAPHRR